MSLISGARGDDRGFTMVTVVLVMMVLSMLSVGAYAASIGDLPIARKDQDRKRAYEAAQAGVDWYLNLLRADPTYWEKCAPATPSAGLPLTIEGAGSSGFWQTVDGDQGDPRPTDAKFRVEIMKKRVAGNPAGVPCSQASPSATALDDKGIFWIRSTGVAGGKVRSVLAGLQQNSDFLRYVYFSNWESQDPQLANATTNWDPDTGRGGSVNQCDYIKSTRDKGPRNQIFVPNDGAGAPGESGEFAIVCVQTQYTEDDVIEGSFHTNDEAIMACGATFGRSGQNDLLEVAGATPTTWNARTDLNSYIGSGLRSGYKCPTNTQTTGSRLKSTVVAPAPTLQLPPSNVRLLNEAEKGGLVLEGQTCIEFTAGSAKMTVYDRPGSTIAGAAPHTQWGLGKGTAADPKAIKCDGGGRQVDVPGNGVVYVKNQDGVPCTPRYGHNAATSYTSSPSCGDVAVKGTYSSSVTIAAENDIIITGDLKKSGNAMLGLIANGFVRIYHPLTGDPYKLDNQETEFVASNGASQFIDCTNYWDGAWLGLHGKLSEAQKAGCGAATGPNVPGPRWRAPNPDLVPESQPCSEWAAETGKPGRMSPVAYTEVETVEAAVLSMRHTLQVDNLVCGEIKKDLTIIGSISGYWAPQLGGKIVVPPILILLPSGLTAKVGYQKKIWKHDSRFLTGQPPQFIAPLNSDGRWVSSRRTEQVPSPVKAACSPATDPPGTNC